MSAAATLALTEALIAAGLAAEAEAQAEARRLLAATAATAVDRHQLDGRAAQVARLWQTRPDLVARLVDGGEVDPRHAAALVALGGGVVGEVAGLLRLAQ